MDSAEQEKGIEWKFIIIYPDIGIDITVIGNIMFNTLNEITTLIQASRYLLLCLATDHILICLVFL